MRPTNGEMSVQFPCAAATAWAMENTSVTLVRMPSASSALAAWMPSQVPATWRTANVEKDA